jgi:hypothetical protein
MKATIVTVLGSLISLAALGAWFYTAPTPGSGWILVVAFLGTLGMLGSIERNALATGAGVVITVAAGAAWYLHQGMPHAGWVLCLCVLAGLRTFAQLNTLVGRETKQAKKSKAKKPDGK